MSSQDEFAMMKADPQGLYNYYINLLLTVGSLESEQLIKFTYCMHVLGLGDTQ